MNKLQLIEKIISNVNIPKAKALETVNVLLSTIVTSIANGEPVVLVNFGSFSSVKRASRLGRNPMTGREVEIPATQAVKFKPGKSFKNAVKKGT